MAKPTRITIDVNVARDFLEPTRRGHTSAKALFALSGDEVELAVAAQGHRLDVDGQLSRDLTELLEREGVSQTRQLAYLSEATYPSENLYPGQIVEGFQEAWNTTVRSWKTSDGRPPEHPDDFHVEAHLLDERDYFLTADRGLLSMCRRLREEHDLAIVAMRCDEYLALRAEKRGTDV